MDDPVLVGLGQGLEDLDAEPLDPLDGQRAVVAQHPLQRPAVEVLHRDEEQPLLGLAEVVEPYRIGMVEVSCQDSLAAEALDHVLVDHRRGQQHLERHRPLHPDLHSLEHHTKAASTDLLHDLVAAQNDIIGLGQFVDCRHVTHIRGPSPILAWVWTQRDEHRLKRL